MFGTLFPLWVMMQIASRAIASEHETARVARQRGRAKNAPIETRPFATSETPTFEPPWRTLKPYFLPCLVLIQALASFVVSGKTEVEPLIVMIFFACAAAGTAAKSDSAAIIATNRIFLADTTTPFDLSIEVGGSLSPAAPRPCD